MSVIYNNKYLFFHHWPVHCLWVGQAYLGLRFWSAPFVSPSRSQAKWVMAARGILSSWQMVEIQEVKPNFTNLYKTCGQT